MGELLMPPYSLRQFCTLIPGGSVLPALWLELEDSRVAMGSAI